MAPVGSAGVRLPVPDGVRTDAVDPLCEAVRVGLLQGRHVLDAGVRELLRRLLPDAVDGLQLRPRLPRLVLAVVADGTAELPRIAVVLVVDDADLREVVFGTAGVGDLGVALPRERQRNRLRPWRRP